MSIARSATAAVLVIAAAGPAFAARKPPTPARVPPLTADAVGAAVFAPLPEPPAKTASPIVFKAEVLLSRARFSPGVLDGINGDNFRKAVTAYQRANGLDGSGKLDQPTWDKLSADKTAPMQTYEVTKADLRVPFAKRIPAKFEAQSRLKRLAYRNLREMLAERFHLSASALATLNKGARFRKVGEKLAVPDLSTEHGTAKAARVVVDKGDHVVEAFAADNKLLAFYPASIGSEEKPAPSGPFEIRRVVHNPDYTYDPDYAFKGVKARKPFTIAPGPNNPVGAVWMDLSYEGYGLHGTPNPEAIGKTQSHGCVRLTNWDALDLASLVDKGTPVSFQDGP